MSIIFEDKTMSESRFHWIDYVVLTLSLFLSVAFGIFYAVRGRTRNGSKTDEFLLAGREMSVFPVSVSLFVSWLSAISILADPVEVYYHGAVYIYCGLGFITACALVAHVFVPFFHDLNITSVYQYIEARYHASLRYIACAVLLVCAILYLGIVVYGPSVALSQVTGIPEWASILTIGIIGTFYTTLGGMKAVLWVDTVQCFIMLAGVITLTVCGTASAGGVAQIWHKSMAHSRLNLDKVDINPLTRSSVWTYLIGGFFRVFVPYISSQHMVQRYFTVQTSKQASMATYWNIPMYFILTLLFTALGLAMFAFYEGCDPLQSGRISSSNQLVPVFMIDVLGFMPGVPGLFLASLFAGALSTLSSVMNAIAANGLVDIIFPLYYRFRGSYPGDAASVIIAKLICVLCGCIVVSVAFCTLYLGFDLYTMTIATAGTLSSPIAAIFFIGKTLPFVDTIGACAGVVASLALSLWWGSGSLRYPAPSQALPTTNITCHRSSINNTLYNVTVFELSTSSDSLINNNLSTVFTTPVPFSSVQMSELYGTSPLWFAAVGFLSTVLVAVIAAGVTHCLRCIIRRIKPSNQYQKAVLLRSVAASHDCDKTRTNNDVL